MKYYLVQQVEWNSSSLEPVRGTFPVFVSSSSPGRAARKYADRMFLAGSRRFYRMRVMELQEGWTLNPECNKRADYYVNLKVAVDAVTRV